MNNNSCDCKNENGQVLNEYGAFPITSAYLILTENCNLRCVYCFERDCAYEHSNMKEEVAYKTVDFLISNANKYNKPFISLTFFGGEPMLVPELMEKVMGYANAKASQFGKYVKYQIITNGTIYNERVEHFLQYWVDNCGKNSLDVQLSVDGIPEIQDTNRPCANPKLLSSKIIEENVPKFKKFFDEHGISREQLHIHCVLSKNSIDHMYDITLYFNTVLHIDAFWFAWCYEDKWDDNDLGKFTNQLAKITDRLMKTTTNINRFPFNKYTKCSGCGSGKNMVSITPTGLVYPCHRFYFYTKEKPDKDLVMGNIMDSENPIDKKLHKYFSDIDFAKYQNDPCQICMACCFEQSGDVEKLWDGYSDVKFQRVIANFRAMFENHIENVNIKKILHSHEDRLQHIEQVMNKFVTAFLSDQDQTIPEGDQSETNNKQ